MRIVYIYDGDWPIGATRVRKQTLAMHAAGHEVLLVARNEGRASRILEETWMTVRRLPTFPGRRLNRAANFPFFLNPVWLAHILRNARAWHADAILVEDLPLALSAIWIGRHLNIPVLYDMGEVYPEFLRGLWEFGEPSFLDHAVRNPKAAEYIERIVLKSADHIFVVSEESRTRAAQRGADPSRMTIVGNTPENPEELRVPRPRPAELEMTPSRPTVLFTGILIFDRGVQYAIEAMSLVRRTIPDALFVIVGDGPEVGRLREIVDRHRLHDHVRFSGWKRHDELTAYYQHSQLGLLPFINGGQIRYTLANKLFDYMGSGLPFVATDVPPMRRIAEETGGGILTPSGDVEALAEAIAHILGLPEPERAAMGTRGAMAVLDKYNWTKDALRFTSAISEIVDSRPAISEQ